MRCLPLLVAAMLVSVSPVSASARGHGGHTSGGTHSSHFSGSSHSKGTGHGSGSHTSKKPGATHHQPKHQKAEGVQRTSHGKMKRDPEQRAKFIHSHPCPSTGKSSGACPGYVVDHVKALKHGGRDEPSNMQWQTTAEAKAKDKWE